MTDKEIIYLYNKGQHEMAFNLIVKNYSERIYHHVRRFVYSHDDANDLTQEIFIKIWAALPSFRADAQLFTWIYRIATNESLNFLRKQKIRTMFSLDSADAMLVRKLQQDEYFNGDKIQTELQKAIIKLPEKQRVVFNLRYFDEMKYEDIAEITGTSVGALKASYHHAYNKIKETLLNL